MLKDETQKEKEAKETGKLAWQRFSDKVDHRYLNDVFEFETSSENIAYHLFVWIKGQIYTIQNNQTNFT